METSDPTGGAYRVRERVSRIDSDNLNEIANEGMEGGGLAKRGEVREKERTGEEGSGGYGSIWILRQQAAP